MTIRQVRAESCEEIITANCIKCTIKPGIYIIEGADGVGKTTLANALADLLDAPLYHSSAPAHSSIALLHAMRETLEHAYIKFKRKQQSTVFDRLYLSTRVYARTRSSGIIDENTKDTELERIDILARDIHSITLTHPVTRVLLTRDLDSTMTTLSARQEHWPHLQQELRLFEQLAGPSWHKMNLDTGLRPTLEQWLIPHTLT